MYKIYFIVLLFSSVQIECFAQRTPATIADSALSLLGDRDNFLPREQLDGKVKSYEISGRLATAADYLAQLFMVHLFGFGEFPNVKSEPKIPGIYEPLVKVAFGTDNNITAAAVLFNGATRKIPIHDAATPDRQNYLSYQYAGDTVIASSKDGDRKMPWVVLRFLRDGILLDAKLRAESDVIFYEEYIFKASSANTNTIDHYTQAVVYDDHYAATYVPDTPGITLRNKYQPEAPDTHALRKRALESRIVIQQTADGYERQYFDGDNLKSPAATTKINRHGLITETTVKYYNRVLIQLAYEYDQHGNWIKCIPAFPDEREMKNISPILRKIVYR